MSVTKWFQFQAAEFYDTGYKSWSRYDKRLGPGGHISKKSSTLAVSVPINLFIKLGSVSVNGPSETYIVDALRTFLFIEKYITYTNDTEE